MNLNKLTILASLPLLAVAANAGTFGQQYIGVQGAYVDGDGFDGNGAAIAYNLPVVQQERFGIDATVGVQYANIDYGRYWGDDDLVSLNGGVVAYFPLNNVVTPFVGVQIGNDWQNAGDESDFVFGGTIGLELSANDQLSFIVNTGAARNEEANATAYSVGVSANYWLTEVVGLNVGFDHTNIQDADDYDTYTAGVLFRF
ncbi:MAG: hypothetical protein Q7P63_02250 [Verrucomicrobiota bacterium JB022]|nr:hypothetical protein [Verrucomicrobiota bacterium JB022]